MFKLKIKSPFGSFAVAIPRELSFEEKQQLLTFAHNITSAPTIKQELANTIQKPPSIIGRTERGQKKLGERPTDTIDWGDYAEPVDGVMLEMLDMPQFGIISGVIRRLKTLVPLSGHGWFSVLMGNYCGLKLDQQTADRVIALFKENGIYAQIIDPETRARIQTVRTNGGN